MCRGLLFAHRSAHPGAEVRGANLRIARYRKKFGSEFVQILSVGDCNCKDLDSSIPCG